MGLQKVEHDWVTFSLYFPLKASVSRMIGDKYLLIFNQKGKLQGFQKLDG